MAEKWTQTDHFIHASKMTAPFVGEEGNMPEHRSSLRDSPLLLDGKLAYASSVRR
jgi:hypothetical protein